MEKSLFSVWDDFYPRPPRGGRLFAVAVVGIGVVISIHALREEGDHMVGAVRQRQQEFLSTPSARRATLHGRERSAVHPISIHALREEGDLLILIIWLLFFKFLSTPSARRATNCQKSVGILSDISIHALREEGDDAP